MSSQILTGRGRASISNKLDQITFDKISFDRQPWTNAIKTLSAEVRKLDPEKRGVNLVLNPNSAATAASTNAQPPKTIPELPLVYVSIKPELTNATLRQVLDALAKSADKPITYQLEEYAVVFSLDDGARITPLVNRSFQADANMMAQALGIISKDTAAVGLLTSNFVLTEPFQAATNAAQIRYAVSNTFKAVGVDLNPALGKTFFYNDREGTILVRATDKELDLIEAYIKKNTIPPPVVNIKIRWVEIPKSLLTPSWLIASSNEFFVPLSDPDVSHKILTEAQTKDVLKRIEHRDGITLLSEGQVTTLPERQAQISTLETWGVVASINPKALTKPGVVSTNNDGTDYLKMETISLGQVFDVIPTVSADEDTISLNMTVTFREFLGYSKAEKEVTIYVDGKKRKTTLPLPIYRVRQITQNPIVSDGQTLLLANLPTKEIAKQPNGEMRTTDVTSTQTNLLFVLITPTIIDPAGNRAKPAPFLNR